MVAGIPPSFLDLVDKAIDAVKNYRPPTVAELDQLKEMAKSCQSLFLREDGPLAAGRPSHAAMVADNPHEDGCPYCG